MPTNNNINYGPQPLPGTTPEPVLGNNIDRRPAAVPQGTATGVYPPVVKPVVPVQEQPVVVPDIPPQKPIIPVFELAVDITANANVAAGPNLSGTNQQRYITILANGAVVTNNATTLNFSGNGVTVSNLGTTGANIVISGGGTNYGNSNVSTFLSAFGSNTISTTGNITAGYFIGDGSQLTNLPGGNGSPSGNNGAVQINWLGTFSNQGGTPGDTYSTLQFNGDGLFNINGNTAYQPRVDYTPYVTINTPRVESTDYGVVAGPGITVVGYDDNYNTPRSAYVSVQDQATATQQWDFGILGNGSNNYSISDRTNGNTWTFGTNGNLTFPENSGDNWPINQQRFGMGNIGAWLDGQWTIGEFSGNGVSGTVGIRIDPAIEGSTGITFPGSASSNTQPVQIYSTNGGGIELYTGSNNWEFNSDGTTLFPNSTINPGNGISLTTRTQSSGNAYTIAYQSSNSWEAYAEDDNTGSHAAYAWIKADLNTVETPRVFITNSKGSDGTELTWTFDAVGNLTLPTNTSSINYANGQPYGGTGSGAANKIVNGNSSANIEFPSGNLAVGINLQPVTGAWINTYGNIIVNGNNDTVGESVIVDEGGNVYVTGTLFNTDFDANQAYVRKLSYTGAVMWQKALPYQTDGSGYSTGESLAIDGAGNLYWLANLYGDFDLVDGSPLVAKLNSSTGESVWTTAVQSGQYAQDITVSGAGQVFVACANNARITSLSSAGAVLWSFDPGYNGTSLLDLGTFVLVGYNNGTVGAYDYSGNLLWINQVFNTGNTVWGLTSDGTDWYAGDDNGYIMKISGADNSTILWQSHINRNGTGGNMFLTWLEWSDGSLYAGGTGNDGSGNTALITVKILASDGTLTWARALEATNTTGQWYWYGHHDLAISGSHYLITGYSQPAQANHDQQVLARLPIDGSLAGSTVGAYRYVDVPALVMTPSDVGGAGYSTPSQPSTVTTTSLTTLNTLVAPYPLVNILSPFTTGPLWSFNSDSILVLPNGAVLKDTSGNSVSFGLNAGANNQSQQSVAIGLNAGANTQSQHSVAIGPNAGQTNQGEDSVAIGWNAGSNNQVRMGIAIGWNAGNDNQGQNSQAYGQSAGAYYQRTGAVAMGLGAGRYLQGQEAVSIGQYAGYGGLQSATVASMPSPDVVRIFGSTSSLYNGMTVVGGSITPGNGLTIVGLSGEDITLSSVPAEPLTNGDNLNFYPAQATGAVAIGSSAGGNLQGYHAVAVGYRAGQTRQGADAVAIGEDAGNYAQGTNSIAIGRTAGTNTQGNSAIAMGWNAGQDFQGQQAIAIGEDAGLSNQGEYSIAVGFKSGYVNQGNNSIVLNATGTQINTSTANSFTVAPVRASTLNNYSQDTGNVLYYNTSTNEVTTAPLNNITGDPFAANIYDSTANVTVWTASSDEVVGAKLTVRVVYASSGWQNTEMLDIMIAKNYPNGTPAFTVSNRVKTNPAYSDTLIDVTLATGNVLQVISSAPSGAGNNVYWTCSATSFNQTLD
jgi:hypothetical protein